MTVTINGTTGITTPDLESEGPVVGTTGTFSGDLTLGSSTLATPTGSAPSYLCRAWVNFNGQGTVAIRASGNVSSITDNSTGNYRVNFTNAMPDINYTALLTSGQGTANGVDDSCRAFRPTTGGFLTTSYQFGVVNQSENSFVDATLVQVAIFR